MERVNRILSHPLYRECLEQIAEAERDRIYCRHDMGHFLDTARLAWIANLEQGLGLDKEMVYGAALLHDIGRAEQYARGKSHDEAGAELIRRIMPECGFSAEETEAAAAAAKGHSRGRGKEAGTGEEKRREGKTLDRLLREADHGSRNCFCCKARESCYWSEERKNSALSG